MIPNSFNADGLLPVGTYDTTLADLRKSILVIGDKSSPTWDTIWRTKLVENAEILVNQLWQVGITEIFFDGSFVENKDHPGDIDGYFDPNLSSLIPADMIKFANIIGRLNVIDPHKVWNWKHSSNGKIPMWNFYKVELFPHLYQTSGIRNAAGTEEQFPAAFRQSRSFKQKGIIRIIK
jgi:hypothetical protein